MNPDSVQRGQLIYRPSARRDWKNKASFRP